MKIETFCHCRNKVLGRQSRQSSLDINWKNIIFNKERRGGGRLGNRLIYKNERDGYILISMM